MRHHHTGCGSTPLLYAAGYFPLHCAKRLNNKDQNMPKRSLLGLLALLLASFSLFADSILNPQHPERYTVVRGDTLWDISQRFLRDPWLWPEVWHVNPEIRNPHLIYPGDIIRLTYIDGRPRLVLERGRPTVRLSPEVRAEPIEAAIPTIPMEVIRPYLTRNRVSNDAELESAPYLLQSVGEHLISGAGDRVYARGIDSSDHLRYGVFRAGAEYRSPRSDEPLGREALYVGEARMQRMGDPATLMLIDTSREALRGDRLLPLVQEDFSPHFFPRPPREAVEGRIIATFDGISQIGQHHVVVLDLGAVDGIEPGHVLAVHKTGAVVPDRVHPVRNESVRLPDERAGVLMVFRTFERVSYGLVMTATDAIHLLDTVRNP
jgi:hypothetical protein